MPKINSTYATPRRDAGTLPAAASGAEAKVRRAESLRPQGIRENKMNKINSTHANPKQDVGGSSIVTQNRVPNITDAQNPARQNQAMSSPTAKRNPMLKVV